ncbi:hypothetical protein BjapCC829_06770 [Bradyrhizobium barranii]|uniref:Uncharacterized protein n=1 Tax=Bradyrhizobium barranii TaxID=2992140 RepID=A0ABY3QQJ9_9BRAD|nr:hypothetical protein [Bradyrhizobium japonicum]UFW88277.1 hypothetical protein BjapCC829_06770 [Bradyrhizobium japonicum]
MIDQLGKGLEALKPEYARLVLLGWRHRRRQREVVSCMESHYFRDHRDVRTQTKHLLIHSLDRLVYKTLYRRRRIQEALKSRLYDDALAQPWAVSRGFKSLENALRNLNRYLSGPLSFARARLRVHLSFIPT